MPFKRGGGGGVLRREGIPVGAEGGVVPFGGQRLGQGGEGVGELGRGGRQKRRLVSCGGLL